MSSPRPETLTRLTDIVFDKVMQVLRTPDKTDPLYELLSDMMTRLDAELDQPLRLSATSPSSTSKLLIRTNRITVGDGGNKMLPPDDGAFSLFPDTTIDFDNGTVSGGTVKRDGSTFSVPNVTVGQYVRVGFAYDSTNNWVNTTFSSAAAAVSGLTAPETLLSALDETWIGYIDLESDGVSSFKTPGASSGKIENAVGGVPYIHRFLFNGPVNTRHLDDVANSAPSDGNFLIYDSGTSKWTPLYLKYKSETATISSNTITPTTGTNIQRITGSAADLQMLTSPVDGKVMVLINETGSSISIKNDTGGTAANRIYTGTGVDLTLKNQAAVILIYDSGLSRWLVAGGSGGGGLATTPQATTVSAQAGSHYLTNTSGGGFTATLPAGVAGSVIMFSDANETWHTNNLTIAPASGEKIDNLATNESLVCDVKGGWVELSWNSALNSWSLRSLSVTQVVTASSIQAGIVSIGNQEFSGVKTFLDGISVSGTQVFLGGNFRIANSAGGLGNSTNPYLTPSDDTNTGLYFVGADNFGFSAGGVQNILFSTTGVIIGPSSGGILLHQFQSGDATEVRISSNGSNKNAYLSFVPTGTGTARLLITSGSFVVSNSSDTAILTGTQAGVWTFGGSYSADTFHIFKGSSGIAFNNDGGAVGIGSNLNFDGTRNFNRVSTSVNGAAIVFDANINASLSAISILVQPPGGTIGDTTGTINVGSITGAGSWRFGPSSNSPEHAFNTGSTNTSSYSAGTIRLGNSGSVVMPAITGTTTSVSASGLYLSAGTNNTNSQPDMAFDVRESDNSDFTTMTSTAFAWTRYATVLGNVTREGAWTFGDTGSGLVLHKFQSGDSTEVRISSTGTNRNAYLSFASTGTGTARLLITNGSFVVSNGSDSAILSGDQAGAFIIGPASGASGNTNIHYAGYHRFRIDSTSKYIDLTNDSSNNYIDGSHTLYIRTNAASSAVNALIASTAGALTFGPSGTNAIQHTVNKQLAFGESNAFTSGTHIWFSSNLLRINGGTSGIQFAKSDNGAQHGLIDDSGVWTLGPQQSLNYNGPVVRINGSAIVAGTPTTPTTDQSGALEINSNLYRGVAGNRYESTLTGAGISFLPRTSDSSSCISFLVNKDNDGLTTSAIIICEANALGAWTFGPSSGAVTHNVNGAFSPGSVAPSAISGTNQTITVTQGGYMRLDSVAAASSVHRIDLGSTSPSGHMLTIYNNGANALDLVTGAGNSGTAYGILTVTSSTIAAGSSAGLIFDGVSSGWRRVW